MTLAEQTLALKRAIGKVNIEVPSTEADKSNNEQFGKKTQYKLATKIAIQGDSDASTGAEVDVLKSPERKPPKTQPRIQNKTHWCYATTALIMVGMSTDQSEINSKASTTEYADFLTDCKPDVREKMREYSKHPDDWAHFGKPVGRVNDVLQKNYDSKTAEKYSDHINGLREGKVAQDFQWKSKTENYVCDPYQEYAVIHYSEESGKRPTDFNNDDGNAVSVLEKISTKKIITASGSFVVGELKTVNGIVSKVNGQKLNMEYIEENLIDPLKRQERVIMNAYTGTGIEGVTGHSYVATRIVSDFMGTENAENTIVALYDCWDGIEYSCTLRKMFLDGFWTPAFNWDTSIYVLNVNRFASAAESKKRKEATDQSTAKAKHATLDKKK